MYALPKSVERSNLIWLAKLCQLVRRKRDNAFHHLSQTILVNVGNASLFQPTFCLTCYVYKRSIRTVNLRVTSSYLLK